MKALVVPVVIAALAAGGCGRARPYRAMAKAATSEESVAAQAGDHRLKMQMRQAILLGDPGTLVDVTPYAYMGHAFLVGFVGDQAAADALAARVRGLDGVRSVDGYLPVRPVDRAVATDHALQAKVKAAVALDPGQIVTQIEIEVLAGRVVLLGVVRSPEAVAAAGRLAASVGGVTGVTNFLLVPEPEYQSLRPRLRDRLAPE
jgi:osmotically-inducible protein OsmY